MSDRSSNDGSIKWINSAGGPLVLSEEQSLTNWGGIFNPRTGIAEPEGTETDYARAGQVEGFLGRILIGAVEALVLWGEPTPTSWVPDAGGGGMLVRWIAAEDERELLDWLPKIPDAAFQSDGPFSVQGSLLLFDSAFAGRNVKKWPDDYLSIDLNPGVYEVMTAIFEPDERNWMVVHRLRPLVPR